MRRVSLAILVTAIAMCACTRAHDSPKAERGHNVILILIDTTRADHVGCYGYERNTTPNLDKFASDAILFTNAISPAPWTTPTVASMFTAQYPHVLGYQDQAVVLDEKFPCLAEILRNSGYATGGIISHAYISDTFGIGQGFDSYDEENAQGHGHVSSPSVTEKAIAFVEENMDRKFFLFVHYFDPHCDYILHEEYDYYPDYEGPLVSGQTISDLRELAPGMTEEDVRFLNALYDSEIRFTDEHVGRFLDVLKELGLYDTSIIVIGADHGEEFLERGDHWIGHTRTVYQELIHVPLMIRLPGEAGARVIDQYVGLVDFTPTILMLNGLEMPDGYTHDGVALEIAGGKTPQARAVFSETMRWGTYQAMIRDGLKLIYDPTNDSTQLIDLAEDPGETRDLGAEDLKTLRMMQTDLHEWDYQMRLRRAELKTRSPKLSQDQVDQLKSLGYIR
ncbi:MAG: sulfatase [Candidatus Eisenbacteria bacterium]